MSTKDKTNGLAAVAPVHSIGKVFFLENTIDLAGVANADVLQLLPAKKGHRVLGFATKVIDPSDVAVATIEIGVTGGDTDGFVASVDLHAAADTMVAGDGALVSAGGYMYTQDDTIDAIAAVTSGPITSGSLKVVALIADFNPVNPS